jgi:phosphoglycolate phosphatase
MDGTLIDSSRLIGGAINHVRDALGLTPMPIDHIVKHVNEPSINPAEFFYKTPSFTDEQYRLFDEYYHNNLTDSITLYDGIIELLDALKTKTLTVATNASDAFANRLLEEMELSHYFTHIQGVNGILKSKPSPDMLNHLLKQTQIDKHATVLIGDSIKDKLAADQAGIDSFLVNWGFTEHAEGALASVEELQKLLTKNI